jgi:hypothetical protein
MALRLEIAEFTDASHWRWRLAETDALFWPTNRSRSTPPIRNIRLCSICRPNSGTSRPPTSGMKTSGIFYRRSAPGSAKTVLGSRIGEKILGHGFSPIVVRVIVPNEAEQLLVMPLEIAHARGKPLALQFCVRGSSSRAGSGTPEGGADRRPAAAFGIVCRRPAAR